MLIKPSRMNNRFFIAFFAIFFLVFIFLFFLTLWPEEIASSDLHPVLIDYKIGIITDFHASSQDARQTKNTDNIIFPNKYTFFLPETLKKMKSEDVKLVVNLGDYTNNASKKHADQVNKIMRETEDVFETLWVKGNHDTTESGIMDIFEVPSNYYFVDKFDWRLIVLDSTDIPDEIKNRPDYNWYDGGLGDNQLGWLRDSLHTEKNIIILMHHPIWEKSDINLLNPIYSEFKEILEKRGNVKYVFSGHWHVSYWEKESNGIKYIGIPAFTLKDNEGYYKVINLPYYHYTSYEPS
jgi:3',5'-cyclic AMP phosphodiesterase CpdA